MARAVKWIVGLVVVIGTASPASAQTCDRACLRTMLDQYLAAVIKHDPAAAPLVVGFRQTENAINVRPGNGVWKTVTGLGKLQRKYFDPVSGQAAYFGTVEEGSETAIVTIRVRVENRKLTEAEWFIARANDPGLDGPRQQGGPPANLHNPDYLTANPPPDRVVPRNQRSDRDALIRIVDSYFDAITSHDGSVALTHQGCGRVENGSPAPAGAFLPPAPRGQGPGRGGAPAADEVHLRRRQHPHRQPAAPAAPGAGRAAGARPATTALAGCRTSTCRWSSRGEHRWWTRKRRSSSPMRCSSAALDRRHRATPSPSGS